MIYIILLADVNETQSARRLLRGTCFELETGNWKLDPPMFVIELINRSVLPSNDAHMTAHVTFLKKHYAAGHFLVSGRKISRDGGIILAVGKDRRQIEAIAAEDPFVVHGLAEVRVIE